MTQSIRRRTLIAAAPAALVLGQLGAGAALGQSAPRVAPPSPAVIASLAPTGRLRAAINLGNAVLAQRDPKTGMVSGIIVDITNELARRLNTPADMIFYDTGGKIAPAEATDHWDITYLGVDQSRVAGFAVTSPYLFLEGTYLVREGAPYKGVADLDQPGVRISAALNSAYDLVLTRTLKHAALVRTPTSPEAIALFETGGLDAAAGIRQALVDAQKATPGFRVLPDAYTRVDQAMTVPAGREVGFRYIAGFIEELKASGFVRAALDRSGQSGAVVAPPQSLG